jgi:hypothetical protein
MTIQGEAKPRKLCNCPDSTSRDNKFHTDRLTSTARPPNKQKNTIFDILTDCINTSEEDIPSRHELKH